MTLNDFNLNTTEKDAVISYSVSGNFPHTMLVEGRDAAGRTEFAEFLANLILCANRTENPCGVCSACIKCAAHSHPDIKEYGEETDGAAFKVDTSREIRSDAFVLPNDSDKKVYIIKEAQNMNENAANAMLKILEEPPHFDYFILTCPSRSAMLDTILSRASLINIGESEEVFSEQAEDAAVEISEALCSDTELAVVEAAAVLSSDKNLFLPVSGCLRVIFTDALIYKQTGKNTSAYGETVEKISQKLSQAKIYAAVNAVTELSARFRQNANYNLLITDLCVMLGRAAGRQ
ncbi:MAG: hypothetical protein E7514_04590 [Ruminococcaceae bacterium]|nr:hypothetical protein [Oscillospiraceae bacterium]